MLARTTTSLYNDDGTSYSYQSGKSTTTQLHWNDASRALSATGGDEAFGKTVSSLVKVIK
jgi:alpha-D-xyloside xylohydrolase